MACDGREDLSNRDVEVGDEELVLRFPHARIDHDNKDLYRGWLRRELRIHRCRECERWHHPPRPICPHCWSTKIVPTPVCGRGKIYLKMLLHQGPEVPEVDYREGPHPVITVELEEQTGLRFTSTMLECASDEIEIGMAVELVWTERHAAPFPAFRPASPSAEQ